MTKTGQCEFQPCRFGHSIARDWHQERQTQHLCASKNGKLPAAETAKKTQSRIVEVTKIAPIPSFANETTGKDKRRRSAMRRYVFSCFKGPMVSRVRCLHTNAIISYASKLLRIFRVPMAITMHTHQCKFHSAYPMNGKAYANQTPP